MGKTNRCGVSSVNGFLYLYFAYTNRPLLLKPGFKYRISPYAINPCNPITLTERINLVSVLRISHDSHKNTRRGDSQSASQGMNHPLSSKPGYP